jgi:predicted transcriptional regulator of viral defense system
VRALALCSGACRPENAESVCVELHGLLDPPAEAIFVTVPSTRRISAPGLVVRTSERIAQATQPGRQPPRTSVEETVLDLAQLAWTFDDACG